MNYPDDYFACIMCGAAEGVACTYISTVPGEQVAGNVRPDPHAARATSREQAPEGPFVPIKDEGSWR